MTYLQKIKLFAIAHKIWSGIIVLAVAGAAWWGYGVLFPTATQTHYVMGTVASSTIVASISESGQVSTSNSVSIQPQVSGTITWVGAKAGQTVRAGQALATIDNTSAAQAIKDAKKTLAADQLQYQQSTAQAPVSYQNDVTALATAKTSLQDTYNTTFNDLSNTYLDLPTVVSGANSILYGYDLSSTKSQWNLDVLTGYFGSLEDTTAVIKFQTKAKADYATANSQYTTAVAAYKLATRTSSNSELDTLLAQTTTMTTAVAQALQSELNFLGAVSDLAQTYNIKLPTAFTTLQTSARTYLSTTNGDLTTLLADKKAIDAGKQTITNDQQTVTLDQVGNPDGTNPISLQISKNSIEKEQEDIANQEADLAKYTIVAPFAGTLSAVSAQVGNSASGSLATIISNTEIVDLSVNEVDAAKIKLGDKATLTFDAIDGLTLTGTVASINSVGTVSAGVVSYAVEISFDTQNAQIKSGMTVNATIQTGVHQNTLVVPSSAVKTQSGQSYVLAFTPAISAADITAAGTAGIVSTTAPSMVPVETGLSDNTNVEILSGLTAGQQIVVSTKTGSATTKTTAAAATSRTSGGGAPGGAAVIRGL